MECSFCENGIYSVLRYSILLVVVLGIFLQFIGFHRITLFVA